MIFEVLNVGLLLILDKLISAFLLLDLDASVAVVHRLQRVCKRLGLGLGVVTLPSCILFVIAQALDGLSRVDHSEKVVRDASLLDFLVEFPVCEKQKLDQCIIS